ncbi:amidohydrolase [Vulcanimicrobium alpinum]|uniref:Amidohydrolase n=1 Tax=Vulcanimicrobium alpinum TaxID=3016050 RepID=A0AAN1XT29_UNVUL|nr:amidohydrolase family protein [Vulcanimicrobium alpinum]BDE05223.1 amidohydrolase [Vulcanimicrobium alpinum]
MRIAIQAGTFFDGTAAPPRTNVTLLVEDGRVARIGDGDPGTVDRRYEAACVVPGLINAHVHLEANGEPDITSLFILKTPLERTLDAVRNARLALEAGVTTVRDLGGAESNAIALRDAIAKGDHPGPTIVAAGRALCMTGGHGWFVGRETDGPWDARKAVREQRKAGADCIKLIATGGVLTKGAVPGLDQLTEEEMRAAILEARTHGMRVAAHAIGTNGIKNALRAGVDSIEHGHLLDDEAIELFKERGACVVPTLAAVSCIYENAKNGAQPDYVVRKATELYDKSRENIGRAWRAGVPIAGGSDAGTPYNFHQNYAYEVELMVTQIGMTPQQALTAANSTSAALLAVDAGTLAEGAPADLLLLRGDVAQDVRALRDPRVVIKRGAVAHERA